MQTTTTTFFFLPNNPTSTCCKLLKLPTTFVTLRPDRHVRPIYNGPPQGGGWIERRKKKCTDNELRPSVGGALAKGSLFSGPQYAHASPSRAEGGAHSHASCFLRYCVHAAGAAFFFHTPTAISSSTDE